MIREPIFAAVKLLRGGKPFTGLEVKALDAAIDEAIGQARQPTKLTNPTAFFTMVRSAFGSLDQSQVEGFNSLLSAMGAARWPMSWVAYGLATAWHETARTMQPVEEAFWKNDAWRKANLRYYPHHGRGYVQLTWPGNYEKADDECGLEGNLVSDLSLAMRPDIAAQIMVRGMEQGWFTGKRLADYLPTDGNAGHDAFERARRIINGTDKAAQIAKQALVFDAALEVGGWA